MKAFEGSYLNNCINLKIRIYCFTMKLWLFKLIYSSYLIYKISTFLTQSSKDSIH